MLRDAYVGVPTWRERRIRWRRRRVKGVWDPRLRRESILLNDGRTLSYFVDGPTTTASSSSSENRSNQFGGIGIGGIGGDNNWPVVFAFHAMCLNGNAFILSEPPSDYVLICVDRPGYFNSSRIDDVAAYSYGQFAHDVEQVADHLGVGQFGVVGHSSGGPCALACAALLPDRVNASAVVSGDPEYARHRNAEGGCDDDAGGGGDGDVGVGGIQDFCLGCLLPALLGCASPVVPMARGMRNGLVVDYDLERRPYPFSLETDIEQPCLVCTGSRDRMVPPEASLATYERLRVGKCGDRAEYRIYDGACHFKLLRDEIMGDIIRSVVEMGSPSYSKSSAGEEAGGGGDRDASPGTGGAGGVFARRKGDDDAVAVR